MTSRQCLPVTNNFHLGHRDDPVVGGAVFPRVAGRIVVYTAPDSARRLELAGEWQSFPR